MKKTKIITVAIAMMAMMGAKAQKAMDKFMVQVDGLGCPFCAYGLEKKFKEFKGIKEVKIDIETGDFSFSYPAEKALGLEAVEKQVEKAGYTPIATKIERADGKVEESSGSPASVSNEKLTTKNLKVAGNCAMCEARITKAAKTLPGVAEVSWDKDTKMMAVAFDGATTSLKAIAQAIAEAGHDTKDFKASGETYDSLPPCCHYERMDQPSK